MRLQFWTCLINLVISLRSAWLLRLSIRVTINRSIIDRFQLRLIWLLINISKSWFGFKDVFFQFNFCLSSVLLDFTRNILKFTLFVILRPTFGTNTAFSSNIEDFMIRVRVSSSHFGFILELYCDSKGKFF